MSLEFTKSKDGYYETTERIKSISVFLRCIKQKWEEWKDKAYWDPNDGPWFRGSHDKSYPLVPGIYRGIDILGWDYFKKDGPEDAEDMKAEFARRAVPFLKQCQHFRSGEYLHLMQHYRFPTRLLDWTEGALIALYFAVRISKKRGKDKHEEQGKENNDEIIHTPCVWMLNPSWLNNVNDVINERAHKNPDLEECKSLVLYTDYWAMRKYREDRIVMKKYLCREDKLSAKYPIAVFPPHIDVRITAQRSVFTIHGKLKDGFEKLNKKYRDAQIVRIPITSDEKEIEQIREDLILLGITETTLFPDLEGLSREIQEEYKMRVKYP